MQYFDFRKTWFSIYFFVIYVLSKNSIKECENVSGIGHNDDEMSKTYSREIRSHTEDSKQLRINQMVYSELQYVGQGYY